MSEFDEVAGSEGTGAEWPSTIASAFNRESQVDFEIEFYREIISRDPDYIEVLRVLGTNLSAKGLHAESLEVDEHLVRLRPEDDVALYNLACSYSMVGMVDSSLELLRRAIESGYDEYEYMQQDSDLEATRRDPRFRKMLSDYGIL